jgi:outer membrane immunogenic protein
MMGDTMRNSKLIFSAAVAIAAILGIGAASAADLPMKAPPMAPVVAPPSWTGFYLGINGGGAWGRTDHTDSFGVTTGNFNTSGGVVGVTYGYNWQAGRFVIGFEGDFDYANINGSLVTAGPPLGLCSIAGGTTCITNMRDFGTDRIRLGFDANGWLLYGTAGIGYGEVNAGQLPCGFITPGIGIGGGFSCNQVWRSGWVAGAGVEKMFAPNWSVKLEYLHYDFGNKVNYTPTILAGGLLTVPVNVLERGDMVRVGVNYHFNWAAPVVAKY